jgi:signal transduction histidine kinase
MKKVALVFVLAVFVPSLVLAWLAVRSLRDQQFLLERQQSLLYQGVADAVANGVQNALAENQRDFTLKVATLLREGNPEDLAKSFDEVLGKEWPLAQVGFVVNLAGTMVCPSPYSSRPEARSFCGNYGQFLSCRESVEVYWNPKQMPNAPAVINAAPQSSYANQSEGNVEQDKRVVATKSQQARSVVPQQQVGSVQKSLQNFNAPAAENAGSQSLAANQADGNAELDKRAWGNKGQIARNVVPQQQASSIQKLLPQEDNQQQFSKVAASEAEFCQLIGSASDGTLARFVDNKLNLLFWFRPSENPQLVFGAQLSLPRLVEGLRPLVQQLEEAFQPEICAALLDDTAKPVALSHPGFQAAWKRPFVATEIGESLPHWEVGVYLLDPAKLTRSARTLKLTLGLLIAVLVLAIGIGSWLIVADLNRQLTLARQKTDFVSNVSHELKTPLTSIRMFSELLAEGRVAEAAKQRSYLAIITAEAARLTRLINNVLDFARIERGEKKYNFRTCDVVAVARETAGTYRPHLEANGFKFECELPERARVVNGDCDALAQVVVNLLSNAEKYSDSRKEITLRVAPKSSPVAYVEVEVLDRGLGVPDGCAEKIFEQFYRAHDSLSSGIQGSGLGLTLARQIARAHGGDVVYQPREGGGSCFLLRLPLVPNQDPKSE